MRPRTGSAASSAKTLIALPSCAAARGARRGAQLGGETTERATARLEATSRGGPRPRRRRPGGLDLGLLRDLGYYTGAILEVYDPALGHILGGGGRYDELMGRFGRPLTAAGFSLYLERLHVAQAEEERLRRRAVMSGLPARPHRGRRAAKLALPRGALFDGSLDLLDRVGVDTAELRGDSRSLVFEPAGLRLVTMRPSDVPTYVEAGAADLGVTGKDVLLEQADRVVYELLDLGYGALPHGPGGAPRGRRALGRVGAPPRGDADRDQIPADRRAHFEATGRQAEVIEVKGSVELAPLAGLADGIVDLVDTGRTLAENDLEVREEIAFAPRAWSPTGSPTSCAPPRSTSSSSGCARRRDEARAIEWDGTDAAALARRRAGPRRR